MNENSCRICLSSEQSELTELFWVESGLTYADKVKFCSGVEVCVKKIIFSKSSLGKIFSDHQK